MSKVWSWWIGPDSYRGCDPILCIIRICNQEWRWNETINQNEENQPAINIVIDGKDMKITKYAPHPLFTPKETD